MRNRSGIFLVALLLAAQTVPATAQDRSWQKKWYWGAQGGAYLFSAGGGDQTGYSAGGHWFITAGRSALYLAFDQLFFDDLTNVPISTGQLVNFNSGQRLQATVYAVPTDGKLQVFLGGGFAIHRITNAEPVAPFTSADQIDVENAATKAFLVLSGGIQARFAARWALFGQYQFMPASNDFVIRSQQHAFNVGLRYALTHSEEIVSTQR
jgi:hypothetical protein